MQIYVNYEHTGALRFYKLIPTYVRSEREIAFDMKLYARINCDFIRNMDVSNSY